MGPRKAARHARIGLQAKSAVALALVVLAAAGASGWLFYTVTSSILLDSDNRQAGRLAGGLAVAAGPSVAAGDPAPLRRLAQDLLSHAKVHDVRILDAHGRTLARASARAFDPAATDREPQPPSLSYQHREGRNLLEIGRPVLVRAGPDARDVLAGAVRLVLDTRETAAVLQGVRRQVSVVLAAIVAALIPLGYFLARGVIVAPVRRLVKATRRLAEGDFSAGCSGPRRSDELGELADAFDSMAARLQLSQRQLRDANEGLEQKVADRTAELQRANLRLRDEMADNEEFLRAVSHDLGAPLRNIAGMTTLIVAKWAGRLPAEVIARLERIKANVAAQTELIGELLELSRIKTRPEKRRLVDFSRLLAELAASLEYELLAKNIALKVHPPMPRLLVERSRMRQVFQNLLDNAIKYMDEKPGSRIDVRYRRSGGAHQFSVADNGPGIAPEDCGRIFQVFRRGATAAAAGVAGKGVGLAFVKSVVSNYDGRVWVESVPGAGSTFYLTLSAACTLGAGPDGAGDGLEVGDGAVKVRQASPAGAGRSAAA